MSDEYAGYDGWDEYPDLTPPPPPPPHPDEELHLTRERPGRKTFLTEEVHKDIMNCLAVGGTVVNACAYSNIKESTYYDWSRRGRKYDLHLETGGEIIDGEDIYRLFYLDIGASRARADMRALGSLAKAQTNGEWRAALAYLERRHPQEWGRVHRLEMTGKDGGPVTVQVEEVDRRLAKDVAELADRYRPTDDVEVEDAEVVEDVPPQLEAGAS